MVPETIAVHIITQAAQIHSRHLDLEERRIQLRALEKNLDHRLEMEDRNIEMARIQAALARDLIHALIDRRIEAVQDGFKAVLNIYNEQSRSYEEEKKKYKDADDMATDPLLAANYQKRISQIDREQEKIRMDSHLLYMEMNTMIIIIGGSMPSIPMINQRTLRLS